MQRWRFFVLLAGPPLIIVASRAITDWWRPEGNGTFPLNSVLEGAEPARLPSTAATPVAGREAKLLEAQCTAAAEALRARLGKECSLIVRSPFVVAGDMSENDLRAWYDRTIEPAARAMAHSYFRKPPSQPITVLLFSKEEPYDRYAEQLFGDEKVSVYGYFKPDIRTLVMNIDTGGGTLVHELTHALISFDFPAVPDWFNEGLASLHEQCRFLPDGKGIEGLTNWRLAGLQTAIRKERLGSLEALIANDDFRGADVGVNYAQARYFCQYLQSKGLLVDFYRQFREHQKTDPRGAVTARAVLGDKEWAVIDREFREWAMGLKF